MKKIDREYRIEYDVLGAVKVPKEAYYGAETQRAKQNFQISGMPIQKEFIIKYAILKRCATKVNLKLNKLDAKKASAIIKACDYIIDGHLSDQFVLDIFQAGAGTSTNMNLNEVIANKALEILGEEKANYTIINPNDHVNMSQSTNDTFHSVTHIATYITLNKKLIPQLVMLKQSLEKKAKEFSKIIKVGRTHLQDAVPITLGQEFSGYAGSISESINNIIQSASWLLNIPIGGTALGTGINTPKGYSQAFIEELNSYTKMNFKRSANLFASMQNQEVELIVADSIRETAVVLTKISNDLRLLSSGPQAGISEIKLPEVQPGSSIMPGKINPSMCEMMNMVCFSVIGSSTTILNAASAGQLELNVFMPIIAYNLLFSIDIMSNAVSSFNKKCIEGIEPNIERINKHASMNLSIATALAPRIGYAKAAAIARKALKQGKSVKQVCLEMKILSKKELDKILDQRKLV